MRAKHVLPAIAFGALLAACAQNGNTVFPSPGAFTNNQKLFENASILHATPSYTAILLPSDFVPWSMTNSGKIAGSVDNHAAVYSDGKVTVLPSYSGCTSGDYALSVNSLGQAVGGCGAGVALYWANGSVRELPSPPPQNGQPNGISEAGAINDAGVILGWGGPSNLDTPDLARFYVNDKAKLFSTTGSVYNVNASGHFAFTGAYFGWLGNTAYVGYGDTLTHVPLRRSNTTALWINESGDVTGEIRWGDGMDRQTASQSYIYTKSVTTVIGSAAGGHFMTPVGIDGADQVVGNADIGNKPATIFLYSAGELIMDVSRYIKPEGTYQNAFQGISYKGAFVAGGPGGNYLITPSNP